LTEHVSNRFKSHGIEEKLLLEIEEALIKYKKAHIKIVWAMHNFKPHVTENEKFEYSLYQLFAHHMDGSIHHSKWGMREVLKLYKFKGKHKVTAHGFFHEEDICTLSKVRARKYLGFAKNNNIYLFVGSIMKNKNIETLIKAFKIRNNHQDVVLIGGVQGNDKTYQNSLIQLADDDNKFRFVGYLESKDLALMARAADLFIFCYGENHLTTASPHLSQTFLLPQIAKKNPYIFEVLQDCAFYFDSEGDEVENIIKALNNATDEQIKEKRQMLKDNRKQFAWDYIGKQTVDFYSELLM